MLARTRRSAERACLPPGTRVYAIGDIHGEANLLSELLKRISADTKDRGPATVTLVFLGDLIDRGPESISLLKVFSSLDDERIKIIKGNHEAALIDVYRGDEEALAFWMKFGGQATLAGLGIDTRDDRATKPSTVLKMLRRALSSEIIDWLDRLPHCWSLGDYFFSHAGIRPGISFRRQDPDDLLWIREPFLSSKRWHGKVVVHGHTIETGMPPLGRNRIGIDTGGHEHGRLTALGLEGNQQWLLQVSDDRASMVRETLG